MKILLFIVIILLFTHPIQAKSNLKDSIPPPPIPFRHFYKITDSLPVIQIQSSKKTYLVGESIFIEAEIHLDSNIVVSQIPHIGSYGDVFFEINNNEGKKVNFYHYEVDYLYSKLYHLTDYYYVVDMLSLHGEPDDFPSSQLLQSYKIKAGKYIIEASVTLFTDKKEYFHSEPVEITIIEPEGEELNARKKYLEIYTIITDTVLDLKMKRSLIEKEINNFVLSFPNSVYTGRLLSLLNFIKTSIELPLTEENKNFVINYYIEEIKKYPESYENYGNVSSLDYYMNDDNELIKISNEYKGTLLEKIITRYLRRKSEMKKHESDQ
jgi:hypothetical protein